MLNILRVAPILFVPREMSKVDKRALCTNYLSLSACKCCVAVVGTYGNYQKSSIIRPFSINPCINNIPLHFTRMNVRLSVDIY